MAKKSSFKDKLIWFKNKVIDFSARKLSDSSATIKDKKTLDETIAISKITTVKDKKTKKEKTFKRYVVIFFWDESTDFFKELVVDYPIIAARAIAKNVVFKLAHSKIKWVTLSTYKIKQIPSLVVFEDEKVKEVMTEKENIEKLVKSFDLDKISTDKKVVKNDK